MTLLTCLPYILAAFLVGACCGAAAGLWMHRTGERDCSDWHMDGPR